MSRKYTLDRDDRRKSTLKRVREAKWCQCRRIDGPLLTGGRRRAATAACRLPLYWDRLRRMVHLLKPSIICMTTQSSPDNSTPTPGLPKMDDPGPLHARHTPNFSSDVTGNVLIHEMAYSAGGQLWFVNTRFSCLATLDPKSSFVPRWRPPFDTVVPLTAVRQRWRTDFLP